DVVDQSDSPAASFRTHRSSSRRLGKGESTRSPAGPRGRAGLPQRGRSGAPSGGVLLVGVVDPGPASEMADRRAAPSVAARAPLPAGATDGERRRERDQRYSLHPRHHPSPFVVSIGISNANVEPRPSLGRAQIRPPISVTSSRQM